ncbi:MAG TPA: tetratricopeptide repeat protein [Acidobacteriota bacterium]|nr:tetratricopeptide repeat protein [Acidobacteriota bacterium]
MKVGHSQAQSRGARTAPCSSEELTRRANAYLQAGDFISAYPSVSQLAQMNPDNPQVSVTAGLIALKCDRRDEAVEHFERALGISPGNYDAGYNLALVYMAQGELHRALHQLRRLAHFHAENAELQNDLAVLWLNAERPSRAEVSFYRALRLDPNFRKARNNAMEYFLRHGLLERARKLLAFQGKCESLSAISRAELSRWQEVLDRAAAGPGPEEAVQASGTAVSESVEPAPPRIGKIAVFASHRAFVQDIVAALGRGNDVRYFEGDTVEQIAELMSWADVSWFEWCDELLIEATKLPKQGRIIARLHSYEAFTDMPSRVDWSKVDRLVFVNESVRDIAAGQIANRVDTVVIHNGLDLERFTIPEDKRYGKKIASVGYINYKKNPPLLLYCFKKIHEYDPAYSLHVAGTHQDSRIALYFDNFLRHSPLPVTFHGWVEDIPAWYADKDFVVSTSLFESFHYSIAEGMASGLMPLVHNWYGADRLYPDGCLFEDPDGCLELVKKYERVDRRRLAVENREYIARRFNLRDKVDQIAGLLLSLKGEDATAERGD